MGASRAGGLVPSAAPRSGPQTKGAQSGPIVVPSAGRITRRLCRHSRLLLELRGLRAPGEGGRRGGPARDHLRHLVEVSGSHLTLVARGAVAARLGGELGLLERAVGGHAALLVIPRQLE